MENQPVISLKNRPYFRDCIQWNEDGQIAVCLESHVHIITPILVDLSSKEESYKHTGFTLPELKPEVKKGTKSVSTDELETSCYNNEGFRCVNWSQTGLAKTQSCFLAVVTTKHRVLLYQSAVRDPINSDWQLFANITDSVKDNAISHEHPTKINPHHTLYASWSKNIVSETFATKTSLLALTNKAGDVCIWTVDSKGVNYSKTVTPHTSFVNLVEWTSWRINEAKTQTTYFASTSTNGTVAVSSVTIRVTVEDHRTTIEDIQVKVLYTWFSDNPSVPTLLKVHDDFKSDTPLLRIAVSKGITIWFLCLSLNEDAMDVDGDWKAHDLQNSALGLSAGAWINDSNFRCYTMEGEGLQLCLNATGELSVDKDVHDTLNNKLVQKYKQQWIDEQEKAEEDEVIGSSDALPYIWGAGDSPNHLFTALYFTMRPTVDVHYKPESSEETNLTFILQKPRGLSSQSLVDEIKNYVNDPNFLFNQPVRGLIREILAYLIEDDNLTPLENWFNELVKYTESTTDLDTTNLTDSLYCKPSTIASRIITNAKLEMKSYKLLTFEDELERIFNLARQSTWENYLKCLFQFVLQLPDENFTRFDEQDKMVLLLLADFALSKSSKALNQHTLDIYTKLQDKFTDLSLYEEIAHLSNPEGPFKTKAREKCPVCDESVQSIDEGTIAQCAAGHFWELCSITRRVLFTPSTRKCSCCGAKSLQPSGDESLTDIILSHCVRCINCGAGLLSS